MDKKQVMSIRQEGKSVYVTRKPLVINTLSKMRSYHQVSQSSIDRIHSLMNTYDYYLFDGVYISSLKT